MMTETFPVVTRIMSAIERGSPTAFESAFQDLTDTAEWRAAFIAISECKGPSLKFRRRAGLAWVAMGHMARPILDDDRLLTKAMKKLLPPYEGPAKALYRGETNDRHLAGHYGPAWSASDTAALDFAMDHARYCDTGAIVLRYTCPADIIVSCLHDVDPENGEFEYFIDIEQADLSTFEVVQVIPARAPPPVLDDFLRRMKT